MTQSRLHQLSALGQSVWIDTLSRDMLRSGQLARLMEEDAVVGVTSNPTIFQKALAEGDAYDDQLRQELQEERDPKELFIRLAAKDITEACDLLRTVWDGGGGKDGYVSIEVDPTLAFDTEGTIAQAQRLHDLIDRPNLFVKIPATEPGLPAIEEMIARGRSINITLIFSLERYAAVAEAYIRGLERLVESGGDPSRIASVASFFVSRVDTEADRRLDEIGGHDELKGKLAIANAKLAYQHYKEIFSGDRWRPLAERGATTQRPLWASTSTKNPAYRDVMYVEDLIGPETVNTMPLETVAAFQDHGQVELTLEREIDEAKQSLRGAGAGRSRLRRRHGDARARGGREVLGLLRRAARGHPGQVRRADPGLAMPPVEAAELVERIWARDASLWTGSDEARWLGWLDEPSRYPREQMQEELGRLRELDVSSCVLLGMGGSSLAPVVMHREMGAESFHVLDSTHPAAVRALEERVDPDDTLFVVSSKSGTTIETRCHLDYFWRKGRTFAAITDPGSELEALGRERGFAAVVWGEPTIGGRYSALSPFGLVPGALIGLDVEQLMTGATEMQEACRTDRNPGLELGLALGNAWLEGRDKVVVPEANGFGLWLEQLLAESTGKEGKGLVPAPGESPEGPDRQPRDVRIGGVGDLGAELYRWEFATAVAGTILEINPFDQPNVQEAKDRTLEVLSGHGQVPGTGTRPEGTAAVEELLAGAQPGDYIAVLAFIDPEREGELRPLVERARSTGCVVTVGLGPRYLHSTGQLHKGGPPTGRFVQVVDDPGDELAIPGRPFGFRTLIHAQADGDLAALEERGRPIVRVTLDDLEAL